jgi:PAS domain S-box-containing protein/putative nucleotidyltransferase with HDIG domain
MANQSMARILGYDSPEDLTSSVTDITHQLYVNPEERAKLLQMIEQQGFARNREVQFYRKDGRIIWVSRTMHAVRNEKSQIMYYEGIIEDITERKESVARLRNALGGTVRAIASIVETRDPYTAGHQRNVANLARAIAGEMGLSKDQIEGIRVAGIIHDIGKISVPAELLSKSRKLTNIELNIIKAHAQSGYDILNDIEFPWPIARMVIEHHERMDGSGYPQKLRGEEILLEARILGVADVVDAIASHRPYRPTLGINFALEEISKNRGVLYDANVVDACLKLFQTKNFTLS